MANLTGLTTNFFPTASETYANNLSSSISALAATVPVNSANEYTDGDVATITVDAGTPLEATFTGVKASTPARFINCIWTEGNLGVGHASGATVIDYDSATHMSQVSKGILKEHKQSGQHSNINADSIQVNGSIIATGDVTEAGVTARTFRTETQFDHIISGGVWSQLSGLNGQMTAVSAYITGYRSSIVAVASRAFTASKDTYVDILRTTVGSVTTFSLVYTEVANNAASPALAANSVRLAIVTTSGVAITSVNQGEEDKVLPISASIPYAVTDPLGNLICPRDPNRRVLGYRQIITSISAFSAETDLTGLNFVINVPTGRKIKLSSNCHFYSTVNGDVAELRIKESTTTLKASRLQVNASTGVATYVEYTATPTAGTHTYKLMGLRIIGSGNLTMEATGVGELAWFKAELA